MTIVMMTIMIIIVKYILKHVFLVIAIVQIEGMSRLQEEVSSLTLQAAHLREENTRLHETLLDQETSFSYALRSSQSEKRELEQKIAHMEIQVTHIKVVNVYIIKNNHFQYKPEFNLQKSQTSIEREQYGRN